MPEDYKVLQQTKAGSVILRQDWLRDQLGVTSIHDIILEVPVPNSQAVILVRLDPDKPVAQTVREITCKKE